MTDHVVRIETETMDTPEPALRPPKLSIHRAFLVRLYPDTRIGLRRIQGQVEHVVSGTSVEFQSVEELLGFMNRMLAARLPGRP